MTIHVDAKRNSVGLLIIGVITVLLLLSVTLLAITSYWWIALSVGLLELAMAWRFRPAPGAEIMRSLIAIFGAVTVLGGIVRLLLG